MKPLTDAQVKALGALAVAEFESPGEWHSCREIVGRWKPGTMEVLRQRGYVLLRYTGKDWEARITPAGLGSATEPGA